MLFSCKSTLKNERLIQALSQQIDNKNVVFLDERDEDEAVEVLAEAFSDDPLWNWATNIDEISNPEMKAAKTNLLRWTFRSWNRHVLSRRSGIMLGATIDEDEKENEDGKIAGVAAIVPSSSSSPGLIDRLMYTIKFGEPPYMKKETKQNYGPWTEKRIDTMDDLDKKRKEIMEPHDEYIYLQMIGVRNSSQGKGVGGKLYRALFSAADVLNVPVYLETESKENESLYRHYGFQTIQKPILIADGDTSEDAPFTDYIMIRYPRA